MDDTSQTPIAKQDLLIKLMRMTTSTNDAESLTALRKANELLRAAGWDWERLINGRIRIIEDPFKNLGTPTAPPPRTVRPAAQPAPPPPPPVSNTTWPLGIQPNRFASFCYCCGNEVLASAGVIFRPNKYHSRAPADWKVACSACNTSATVYATASVRARPLRGKRHVSDLA